MCRIAGILTKTTLNTRTGAIAMRDVMAHGGPDDEGLYVSADNKLALAHRRLSIIDLSAGGHQPMHSEDGGVVLVYNGEIYNYKELKQQLQSAGYHFHTSSDTEVIIKSYQHWGTACFAKLKGMFALALHDNKQCQLILARDPNGIKPLYYAYTDDTVYFASEIKAFKTLSVRWQENEAWKAYILIYGYVPEPHTTLKGVRMHAKGSYTTIDTITLQTTTTVFAADAYADVITDEETAKEQVKHVLNQAVDRHLISDASIGMFLSGGIDSSLITLIAKQTGHTDLHTLSIVFDDKDFSEERYQQTIAGLVQSKHKSFKLTKETFFDALPDIFKAMDQPSTDGINTYFICKYAKEYGLKAVLSGLGADELFGGYASFYRGNMLKRLKALPPALLKAGNLLGKDKYQKVTYLADKHPLSEYLFNRGFYSIKEAASVLNADAKEITQIAYNVSVDNNIASQAYGNRASYMEKNLYMQSQLLRDTDVMSMWHSVEVRVPFLDTDLVNLVNNISPSVKYNEAMPKHLLVKAYNDVLPREIWDRKKQGFVFPFRNWMKGNEEICFTQTSKQIVKAYQAGNINWSRYWAYLVMANYNHLHQ